MITNVNELSNVLVENISEDTSMYFGGDSINGNKARPVSYRTVQKKLHETKYHKYVAKKASEFATTMSKHGLLLPSTTVKADTPSYVMQPQILKLTRTPRTGFKNGGVHSSPVRLQISTRLSIHTSFTR
jgi:hypothetical protein